MPRLNLPLKIAVIKSGRAQGELAKLARMHYSRFSFIVNGRVKPNESERLRIAGVLRSSVEELFGEEVAS